MRVIASLAWFRRWADAERFNLTLKREWAYVRLYTSTAARTARLDRWLHGYNHHRFHHAIGGPPITRGNNVPAYDS